MPPQQGKCHVDKVAKPLFTGYRSTVDSVSVTSTRTFGLFQAGNAHANWIT